MAYAMSCCNGMHDTPIILLTGDTVLGDEREEELMDNFEAYSLHRTHPIDRDEFGNVNLSGIIKRAKDYAFRFCQWMIGGAR